MLGASAATLTLLLHQSQWSMVHELATQVGWQGMPGAAWKPLRCKPACPLNTAPCVHMPHSSLKARQLLTRGAATMQVANRPDDVPPEAWIVFLLASNVLRVAVCGALCFVAARQAA